MSAVGQKRTLATPQQKVSFTPRKRTFQSIPVNVGGDGGCGQLGGDPSYGGRWMMR